MKSALFPGVQPRLLLSSPLPELQVLSNTTRCRAAPRGACCCCWLFMCCCSSSHCRVSAATVSPALPAATSQCVVADPAAAAAAPVKLARVHQQQWGIGTVVPVLQSRCGRLRLKLRVCEVTLVHLVVMATASSSQTAAEQYTCLVLTAPPTVRREHCTVCLAAASAAIK